VIQNDAFQSGQVRVDTLQYYLVSCTAVLYIGTECEGPYADIDVDKSVWLTELVAFPESESAHETLFTDFVWGRVLQSWLAQHGPALLHRGWTPDLSTRKHRATVFTDMGPICPPAVPLSDLELLCYVQKSS